MPAGADASVMVEDTERVDNDHVLIKRSVREHGSVRDVGEDVRVGTELFAAGTVVRPAVAGIAALHIALHIAPTATPECGQVARGLDRTPSG